MKKRNYYQLNEDEEIIGSSDVASLVFDRGGFLLTNQRVIKVIRTPLGGGSKVHSFNLENLDSVQTAALKKVFLIIFAFVCLLFVEINEVGLYFGIGFFIFFWILYFLTRRKVIKLSSGNSIMWLNVSAMAHENIQKMVFKIEQAKQTRLESMQESKSSPVIETKQRLRELQILLDEGLINDEEYQSKRQQILDQM